MTHFARGHRRKLIEVEKFGAKRNSTSKGGLKHCQEKTAHEMAEQKDVLTLAFLGRATHVKLRQRSPREDKT